MSFSFSQSDVAADDAKLALADDQQVPGPIKEYVILGIDMLKVRHGKDVKVNVSAYGHLHNGEEGNYDVTNAAIGISRSGA